MNNSKLSLLAATLAISICAHAQVNARKGWDAPPPKQKVSIGFGSSFPNSTAKDNANLVNSTTINAEVFLALLQNESAHFNFGINLGGVYNFGGSGTPGSPLPAGYTVTSASSNSIIYKGVDPRNPGFRTGAGPQANFYLGKFIISPMVLGEYFSMTQKELSIVQTTQYNGQPYDFTLTKMPETKTTGFALTPKLRLQYTLGKSIGLFAEAAYTAGPKIETQLTKLIPNGPAQTPGNTYDLQQLQTATYQKGEITKTSYNAMSFGGGISFAFGNRKGWNGKQGTTKNDDKGWNGKTETAEAIRKGWDGTVKGLFDIKNSNILVSKNGGIEKLVEEINKEGKAKASLVKNSDKQFVKIVRKEKDIFITEFYPYDGSGAGPMGIINGGYSISCQGSCSIGCELNTAGNACTPCDNMASCALVRHSGSPWFHDYFDYEAVHISFPISTDGAGTLTETSIKDIKNLILKSFPKATMTKLEIIKERKDKFIKVDLDENGNVYSVVNFINNPNHTWVLLACTGSCNGSITNCTSKNVNLLGECNCPGDNHCFGLNGILIGLSSDIKLQD